MSERGLFRGGGNVVKSPVVKEGYIYIGSLVILTLIVILSIRERRYEIGVLMSLGESRLKILGKFRLGPL